MRYLTPWRWGKGITERSEENEHPVVHFQRALNNLFDDFFKGVDLSPFEEGFGKFSPKLDMVEDEKDIKVTVELPGIDEKNIEISLNKDALIIKGEKTQEKEEKGKERYFMERSYGSFQRMISLPDEVDTEKIDATFKKGILSITMPKINKAKEAQKKIEIKSL